jgi:hypothetical protein
MPLIHSKRPSAFKKNIETEMHAGKPQKQAVAIAYRMAGEHRAEGGCIGASCPGCSSANCMAEGGNVNYSGNPGHSRVNEKGIHSDIGGGMSTAGAHARSTQPSRTLQQKERGKGWAKEEHGRVLSEMRGMKKPNLYAEGGSVDSWTKREDNEKGINKDRGAGMSSSGMHVRVGNSDSIYSNKQDSYDAAKRRHKGVLGEMRSMPKPKLMAEGGEIKPHSDPTGTIIHDKEKAERLRKEKIESDARDYESERDYERGHDNGDYAKGGEVHEDEAQDKNLIDDELHHMMGEELMAAFDSKDKKRIMEGIEAIVMSCLAKE